MTISRSSSPNHLPSTILVCRSWTWISASGHRPFNRVPTDVLVDISRPPIAIRGATTPSGNSEARVEATPATSSTTAVTSFSS